VYVAEVLVLLVVIQYNVLVVRSVEV